MGTVRRTFTAAALLVVAFAASAAFAQVGLEELLIPDTGMTGFAVAPADSGLPNGPVDLAELASLLPANVDKPPAEVFRDIEVVARSWVDGRGGLALILLYRLPKVSLAEEFFGGFARAVKKSESITDTFPVPSLGGAIGQTVRAPTGERLEQVAFGRDRIIAQIGVLASDTIGRPQVVQMAIRQASRLPGAPTAQAPEESIGYKIGRRVGAVLPIALIVAIVIWFVMRRRRAAFQLPEGPPVPPPIPPPGAAPPAPRSGAGDGPPSSPAS